MSIWYKNPSLLSLDFEEFGEKISMKNRLGDISRPLQYSYRNAVARKSSLVVTPANQDPSLVLLP